MGCFACYFERIFLHRHQTSVHKGIKMAMAKPMKCKIDVSVHRLCKVTCTNKDCTFDTTRVTSQRQAQSIGFSTNRKKPKNEGRFNVIYLVGCFL